MLEITVKLVDNNGKCLEFNPPLAIACQRDHGSEMNITFRRAMDDEFPNESVDIWPNDVKSRYAFQNWSAEKTLAAPGASFSVTTKASLGLAPRPTGRCATSEADESKYTWVVYLGHNPSNPPRCGGSDHGKIHIEC